MFVVNSRLGLFSATYIGFTRFMATLYRFPFSRSYGDILPSSLTRVLPRTLGFSPRIPVSVYGTGGKVLTRSFSRQRGVSSFGNKFPPRHTSGVRCADLPTHHPTCLHANNQSRALPALLRHSIAQTNLTGAGISTSCPSPTLIASD